MMATQSLNSVSPVAVSSAATPTDHRKRISMFWFAATTLLGAFLVFQVQPVISKCVLPWFGGTPAVWTTCMLFFQVLLFGGYLYAHVLRTYFRPAAQALIHLALLSFAVLLLPIEPGDHWKPTGSESPTLYLLWMLAAHVGLPYFMLSSTGPLIQAWLSYHDNSDRVYRLYALSNAGSLAALLSYPFLVEPVLSVSQQSTAWSLMLCLFLLIQGMVAISLLRVRSDAANPQTSDTNDEDSIEVTWKIRAAWVGLPALASTMLLVITNHVCQDVAVVPFLWVLPLSLYLLSFIVSFDSPQWYKPKMVAVMTVLAIVGIESKNLIPYDLQLLSVVTSFMTFLFGVCMMCHGEVARLKPPAKLLTQYYALLSFGGAIGGMIVAVVCPLIFNSFIELPVSIILVQGFIFVLFVSVKGWKSPTYDWNRAYRLRYFAAILMIAPALGLFRGSDENTIASERNFFGVLRVMEDERGLHLVHGTTIHGMQRHGEAKNQPTKYYGHESGVGRAIRQLQSENESLNIGVVGLGCGVLTCYGRPEDHFDLIEINPAVVDIAQHYFSFMRDCPSSQTHHLGDGRLVLERMTDAKFDVLVLDAFSSDAIPAHLLTYEAIELFRSRMTERGVMAIHVSNTHLSLEPLVHRLCHEAGLDSRVIKSGADKEKCTSSALWIVVTEPGHAIWETEALAVGVPAAEAELKDAPFWTDQHHNLVSVLRAW
ncbi:spermidine synthase [Rubripirellula amarantea]|uniref:Spermidine synthase n=1 Tax=Rubripirellula amarantea TaxID=2527999 RepID=A0A5C5WJG2_9BACT|nr:fused MFS/spermidine synthase [Rubripirellula amarantea]TWT50790.1 spermidine synthase [Rubripirellula amarantea]